MIILALKVRQVGGEPRAEVTRCPAKTRLVSGGVGGGGDGADCVGCLGDSTRWCTMAE